MKVTLIVIVIILGSCSNEKSSRLHVINQDIDSLQHQFVDLMGNYNLNTYDSITPMIEQNIQLRSALINEAEYLKSVSE